MAYNKEKMDMEPPLKQVNLNIYYVNLNIYYQFGNGHF